MSHHDPCRRNRLIAFSMAMLLCPVAPGQEPGSKAPLSLREAEQLALRNDPVAQQREAQAQAFSERAVAEGQLPDPQLSLGLGDVPSNFKVDQDPDAELQLGLSQAFPRGRTLRYKSEQTNAMAQAENARAEDQRRTVLKAVRAAYLELSHQTHALAILEENRTLFAQLREVTEQQYAAGRDNQHEVLRAQLELSLLEDRLAEVAGMREAAGADLAKWITTPEAERTLPAQYPALPEVLDLAALLAALRCHPLMQAESALVQASMKSLAIAREQYKPGWMLNIMYGHRTSGGFEDNTSGERFSAAVTVDLPLFREKRQDRTLASSQWEHEAAEYSRVDRLRELTRMAQGEYATWKQLGKRLDIYTGRASLEATQNAEATFNAYQNGLTDFTTLARARMTVIETELARLRVQSERGKAQANLLYLAGDCP
jgi:outer membrane protein TolC